MYHPYKNKGVGDKLFSNDWHNCRENCMPHDMPCTEEMVHVYELTGTSIASLIVHPDKEST